LTNETVTYETEVSRRNAINSADQSHWDHWINREQRDNQVPFQRIGKSGSVARLLKRAFDLIGAGIGTVLLLPLLAVICAAIKLTSNGPVFFRQQRYGLNGTPFTVLKFRTMHTHLCDRTGVEQTVANDPRITWIGNFLRKSNFDELPQLINVLKGDMSLVGPRPHVPGMLAAGMPYEIFDKRYMDRHQVRPGITGLAQVQGFRGETKDEFAASMRLELDLKYIETRSLLLDLKIVVKTIAYEFFTGNGY
jgi:polysaccharide biosynthesis protein PslA